MPCNFISSCFFLDAPWHRDPDCLPGAEDAPPIPADHWPLQELDIQQQPIVDQQPGAGVPGGEVATGSAAVNGGAASTENGAAPPKDGVTKVSNVPRAAKTFRAYLPSCHRTYSCVHCRAHLANHDELISKSFQGSQGRAYLFNSVVNIGCGQAEERVLLTGLHAVADIYCDCCKTTLGWKYEQAYESSQKYKEGKFIIELAHMIKENGWENES